MKTKTLFCALALLAMIVAVEASAEARNYIPHRTTVQQLANTAQEIVVGELQSVEDVKLTEVGLDAAKYKRINDGKWQNGEDYVRREAILQVNSTIKGTSQPGTELRFVSIRQLKLADYDADLRSGEAIYFLHRREDGRYIVLSDERGTVTKDESQGDLNKTIDFVKNLVAEPEVSPLTIDRMLDAISLNGSRLSVDCSIELSWHHDVYAPQMNAEQRTRILDLCKLSAAGTEERNQLLTAAGRHPAEGALDGLLEVMFSDPSWSTTSLGAMSLEYVDRGQAINRLLNEYDLATDDNVKMVIVRALGLIRPKADYDGAEPRNRTLNLVKGLLKADVDTNKDLLREALIASRDLRSQDAHVAELKALIDNRETNGLGDAEVKAAIVALAAARTVDAEGKTTILAQDYLVALGEADAVLKQAAESAMKFPYTTLILGADGKGH
ncbi:MAG: hypothetical protein KDB82_15625 [Planctomycetes bacterium]|nr:hypothetical protein [Planctomycetota bacterium]